MDANYSHSTAILLALTPDAQLNDIESVGIGLIGHRCGAPLEQISSIPQLIKYVYSLLGFERASFTPQHRMYCMIVGNYGGHLDYTMDPSFCVAYALDFINKSDPAVMKFRNLDNHPVSFTGDGLIICQILAWDCLECEYVRTNHNRCLLIPRGMQFSKELFPGIVVLQKNAASYCDPITGKETPFLTEGPFSTTDMLLSGITRDLELYTTEEVMSLRSTGISKFSSFASLA